MVSLVRLPWQTESALEPPCCDACKQPSCGHFCLFAFRMQPLSQTKAIGSAPAYVMMAHVSLCGDGTRAILSHGTTVR